MKKSTRNNFQRGKKKAINKNSTNEEFRDESKRLNKYIAHAGICSRREADKFIQAGLVSVNGKTITKMGYKVIPADKVRFNNTIIHSEKLKYLLLNKPKNYITSIDKWQKKNTVMHLIRGSCKEHIFPIDRLDRTATGLLLFTNDRDLAKKLTNPKRSIKKIYKISLDKNLKAKDLKIIQSGLKLEDKYFKIDSISYIQGKEKREIGIEIHLGSHNIIKKIFEYLGYKLVKLDRVFFGGLTKKNLPRKEYRFLSKEEINILKRL